MFTTINCATQQIPLVKHVMHLDSTYPIKSTIAQIKEELLDVANERNNVDVKSAECQCNILSQLNPSIKKPFSKTQAFTLDKPKIDNTKGSSCVTIFYSPDPILFNGQLFIVEKGTHALTQIHASINSQLISLLTNSKEITYPLQFYYAKASKFITFQGIGIYPILLLSRDSVDVALYTKTEEEQVKWVNAINKATSRIILDSKYLLGDILGYGSYGMVYVAKNRFTEEIVAIKIIRKKDISHEATLWKEIDVLKLCRHPNIVKFIEAIDSPHSVALVMEHLSGGSLKKYVNYFFTISRIREIMESLTSALCFLKRLGVVHRDIKHENILFVSSQPNSDVKLVDFGLTSICYPNDKMRGFAGTVCYLSPELILNKTYDFKTDIWSLGVVFYSMLCRELPFKGHSILQSILNEEPNFEKVLTERGSDAFDLILKMLSKDPKNRIPISELRKHHFLTQKYPITEREEFSQLKRHSSSLKNIHSLHS